jgi:hypothetical protein
MSFQPEAVRAFEHAGWQRAASSYGNSFAHATAPFVLPLLEAAEISPGQHVLDVAPPRKRWTFQPRWLALPAASILTSS